MAIPDPPPHPTHYRILLSDPEGYDTVQGYEEVEWTLPVSGETLPNGWRQFDIPFARCRPPDMGQRRLDLQRVEQHSTARKSCHLSD